MAVQPWKPNHFLFDFTVIFVIVAILVCVATVILHLAFTSAGIPIQGINFNTFILIFIITTLLTVVGRWIQIGRARRNNWVEEIPGSAPDPDAPLDYSEETKEEWKRLQQASIIPIIGQTKSLDFLDIMNTKKIVVCRFSKGRLGEEIAQILGSLIVSMVSISALKREKQKARPPFMLVADEVHNFVHGGRFGTLLAESRKYGITLVLASQGMYQLPFAKDVFSNCPTQITFNVSGDDAKAIEENWNEEQVQATHITSLPRYSFYCRTFIDDLPHARRVVGWPSVQKRGDESNPTRLIKQSLMRWGRSGKM